jgi:hypothetical protein
MLTGEIHQERCSGLSVIAATAALNGRSARGGVMAEAAEVDNRAGQPGFGLWNARNQGLYPRFLLVAPHPAEPAI